MESFTLLCLPTPEANAIWTIRMIKGSDVETITEAVGAFQIFLF